MSKLEVIIIQCANEVLDLNKTNDPTGTPIDKAKQDIKEWILAQKWYYYDPDEVGEDAFKPLGKDEVDEL